MRRCVGDPDIFARDYWARRPLELASGDAAGFDGLLSLDDVDRIVSSAGLRQPAFRLVKEGKTLPSTAYTKTTRTGSTSAGGVADAAAMFAEFEAGATIVLQGMHRYWGPLARFCRDLELALGHPVQANAYITPPGSRGLAVHQDDHDVFVLQSYGTKRWQVYERGDLPPTRPPLIETELSPGASLYVPRAFPHAASTQHAASVHLTIGILSYSWLSVLQEVVKLAETEPAFSEPLPLRFAEDPALQELVEQRLREMGDWVAKIDPEPLSAGLRRRFLTGRQPMLRGQLRRLLDLDSLNDESLVRRREGSICVLVHEGEELSVLLGDRELRMPAWVEPAMAEIGGREELAVGDLGPHLDAESRLVLVRRLIREGLLEVRG